MHNIAINFANAHSPHAPIPIHCILELVPDSHPLRPSDMIISDSIVAPIYLNASRCDILLGYSPCWDGVDDKIVINYVVGSLRRLYADAVASCVVQQVVLYCEGLGWVRQGYAAGVCVVDTAVLYVRSWWHALVQYSYAVVILYLGLSAFGHLQIRNPEVSIISLVTTSSNEHGPESLPLPVIHALNHNIAVQITNLSTYLPPINLYTPVLVIEALFNLYISITTNPFNCLNLSLR